MNSLEVMNKFQIDEELINIAKEEAKKFSEAFDYKRYQIGEEINFELGKRFNKEKSASVALEDIDCDNLIAKFIINEDDKELKGREIIKNNFYTHIGFFKLEFEEENFMVIIFSTMN